MSESKESAEIIATNNVALETLLILLLGGILVSNFSQEVGFWGQFLFSIVLTFFMTTAAFILAREELKRWCAVFLAGIALLSHWMQYFFSASHLLTVGEIIFSLFFLILLERAVLIRIFDQSPVDRYKIEGAIIVYLLTVAIWAQLYLITEMYVPGSFQFNTAAPPNDFESIRKNLDYYSFSVITTLGMGDILPIRAMARTLTSLEATVGVLFPNIFIARLVSLEIIHSKRGR